MRRALPLLLLLAACDAAPEPAGASLSPALQARYLNHCANCHETGAADAPVRGDEADWSRRRARGFDVLFARLRTGTNAMPPKGLCWDCSDEELTALARYVSGWEDGR